MKPGNEKTHTHTVFTAALFIIKKMWYIDTMKCYSVI